MSEIGINDLLEGSYTRMVDPQGRPLTWRGRWLPAAVSTIDLWGPTASDAFAAEYPFHYYKLESPP